MHNSVIVYVCTTTVCLYEYVFMPDETLPYSFVQGSKCAVSRIPEEFNIHGGKSTNLLTFPVGKVSI